MGSEGDGREGALRGEVRAWLADNWDTDLTLREWWRRLADSGWGFPTWPERWGGRDLPAEEGTVVLGELAAAGVVGPPAGLGQIMGAPVILGHGDDDQRERWVRRLARGEEAWCQFFSEPEAGSDLASARTRAERDGDEWVVNGQKVWTSGALHCDRGMLIARTNWDVPKHRGLTYFICDVDQPGIEIRPLRQMNGAAHFNEVFFSDARVPDANRVGEDGQGWAAAVTTLAYERAGITRRGQVVTATPGEKAGMLDRTVGAILAAAAAEGGEGADGYAIRTGRSMVDLARRRHRTDEVVVRDELATLWSLNEVARYSRLRVQAAAGAGRRPGPEANTAKLNRSASSRLAQHLGMELLGAHGMLAAGDAPDGGAVETMVLSVPSTSIAGGTDEVQRNILGERALGLPKDISVDREVPFREVRASGS